MNCNIPVNFTSSRKIVCLTVDIESDFGELLDTPEYDGIKCIPCFVKYFKKKNIPLTCFIQGSLLETHRSYIDVLTELNADFHLHSFSHDRPDSCNFEYEIKAGKNAFNNYFGYQPEGYRAPLGIINNDDFITLQKEGFLFDSSIFPSFRPAAFNNMKAPITPYKIGNKGIIEFPFTVLSKWLRIPLSISYIKLLGWPYKFLIKTIKLPDFIIIGFHLHDLYELKSSSSLFTNNFTYLYNTIYKRIYIQNRVSGLELLNDVITHLQGGGYTFLKMKDIFKIISNGDVK
jgi:peptidoglycan/xylan/chitin deacetylase (PgdA/CDA1 family)